VLGVRVAHLNGGSAKDPVDDLHEDFPVREVALRLR
jgi:hypothetical protein